MAKKKLRENRVFQRLQLWFIFDVIVTLTPFIFGFLQSIDRNKAFSFSAILGTGQLLLVCVAISASAAGELILVNVPDMQKVMKSSAIGLCFLVIIVSALWFGDISASILGKTTPDPRTISAGSAFVYLWALSASAWCLSLSTVKLGDDQETDERQVTDTLLQFESGEEEE